MTPSTQAPTPISDNPYVGPRTFVESQRQLFFGREQEARDLTARVVSERLLLFYAQSGAGKSSLINTRLIPNLRDEEGFQILPTGRVSGELPKNVAQVDNIYAFNLMASLATAQEDPGQFAHLSLTHFLARLVSEVYEDDHGEPKRRWVYRPDAQLDPDSGQRQSSWATPRYALIIDQFEEIITSHPDRWSERADFFRQLNQALLDDPNLWVVLSLREDYVANLDPYADLMFNRLRARFRMERMGVDAALEAVTAPALAGGRPFAPGVAEQLVDNLRQVRVMGQQRTLPGQYVEPVQLQAVCFQLWENLDCAESPDQSAPDRRITLTDLEKAGGVDQALSQFYQEALEIVLAHSDIQIFERQLRTWFDTQLITDVGTRGLVYQGETTTAGMVNTAVALLMQKFILRADLRAGGTWIELVHDRFVEPIRRNNEAWWPKNLSPLQRQAVLWQEEGRPSGLLLRGEALKEAENWTTRQDEPLEDHETAFLEACRAAAALEARERRQSRRLRILALVAVMFGVVAIGLAFFALDRTRQANFAQELALNAQATAVAEAARAVAEAARADENATAAQNGQAEAEKQAEAARFAERMAKDEQHKAMEAQDLADTEASNARSSLVGQFVFRARMLSDLRPQFSNLLAVESTILSRDTAVDHQNADIEQALFDVLSEPSGLPLPGHEGDAGAFAISPDSQWLAVGSRHGVIQFWQIERLSDGPTLLAELPNSIRGVIFTPDNRQLITVDERGAVMVWPISDEGPHAAPAQLTCPVWAQTENLSVGSKVLLSVSPDNKWLAIGGGAPEQVTGDMPGSYRMEYGIPVCIWQLDALAMSPSNNLEGESVASDGLHLFTTNSQWLIVSDSSTGIRAIRLAQTGLLEGEREDLLLSSDFMNANQFMPGHRVMKISPDGARLITSDLNNLTCLWNISRLQEPEPSISEPECFLDYYSGFGGAAQYFFDPSASALFAVSDDGQGGTRVVRWELTPDGRGDEQSISYDDFQIKRTTFVPQTDLVALATDGLLRIWLDTESLAIGNKEANQFYGQDTPIDQLMFSPNGEWLVSGDIYGLLRLWRIDRRGNEMQGGVLPLTYDNELIHPKSKDSFESPLPTHWILTRNEHGANVLRDANRPESTGRVMPEAMNPGGALFSTLGRWMATTEASNSVLIAERSGSDGDWTIVTEIGRKLLAASPDGRWLVFRDEDQDGQIWDNQYNRSVATIPNLVEWPTPLFSPNSHWLRTIDTQGQRIIWDMQPGGMVSAYQEETSWFSDAFSPDGRLYLIFGDDPEGVAVFDLSTDEPFVKKSVIKGIQGSFDRIDFSSDETQAYVVTSRAGYYVDLRENAPSLRGQRLKVGLNFSAQPGVFSENGRWLITSNSNYGPNNVNIWDTTDIPTPAKLEPDVDITLAAIANDNSTMAVVDQMGTIYLYRLLADTWSRDRTIARDLVWGNKSIAFDHTSQRIAYMPNQDDPSFRIWNISTPGDGIQPFTIVFGEGSSTDILYPPDGNFLVNGRWVLALVHERSAIKIYDILAADPTQSVGVFTHGSNYVVNHSFTDDNRWLVLQWSDGVVQRIDLQTDLSVLFAQTIGDFAGQINNMTITANGELVIFGKTVAIIDLWNLQDEQDLEKPQFHGSYWGGVVSILDGSDTPLVVLANSAGEHYLWNVLSDALPVLLHDTDDVMSSPNGIWLLGRSYSNSTWYLWNTAEDSPLHSLQLGRIDDQVELYVLAFSPDGSLLIGAEVQYDIESFNLVVWETNSPEQPLRRFNVKSANVLGTYPSHASISPDNRWLAVGWTDGRVVLWDMDSESDIPFREWTAHDVGIDTLTFDPTGRVLMTASVDREVITWHLDWTMPEGARLETQGNGPLSFSPDGEWLIQTNSDLIQFWPTQLDTLVSLACRNAGRNLMIQEWIELFPNQKYRVTCSQYPIHPSVSQYYKDEGESLARQGRISQAATAFEQAQAYDPAFGVDPEAEARRIYASALIGDGDSLARQGDVPGAVTKYQEALVLNQGLDIDPETRAAQTYSQVLIYEGKTLASQGDVSGAVAKFEQAVEYDSTLDIDPKSEAIGLAGPVILELIERAMAENEETVALDLGQRVLAYGSDVANFRLCNLGRYQALAEAVTTACNHLVQTPQIRAGEVATGTIRDAYGDLWMLTINQSSLVSVTLSADDGSVLDTFLQLYDAQFRLVAEHDDISIGVIQNSQLSSIELLEPGQYWIVASRCCPNNDQGSRGAYVLKVAAEAIEKR